MSAAIAREIRRKSGPAAEDSSPSCRSHERTGLFIFANPDLWIRPLYVHDAGMDAFPVTSRTRLRRKPGRGSYDRATVHAILDEGLVCHVGFVIHGEPF